jgi:hypothetical protein
MEFILSFVKGKILLLKYHIPREMVWKAGKAGLRRKRE